MKPPYSKYRTSKAERGSVGKHMIYTEALTLDDALEILAAKKNRQTRKKQFRKNCNRAEIELGEKAPVTLPKLKFMQDKS